MELNELQPLRIGEMVRVGDKEDGGYVIPNYFRDSRLTLISIGLGDNWSFENQGKGIFFDRFISIDHTVSFSSIVGRLLNRILTRNINLSNCLYFIKLIAQYLKTFKILRNSHIRKKLVSSNNKKVKNEITLDECFSITGDKNVILKIDIEGDEYKIIEDVFRYTEKIELFIIEFHFTERQLHDFSTAISRLKEFFLLAHTHANNFDFVSVNGIPNTVELTFVNKNIFNGNYDKIQNCPIIEIDYPCNPIKSDINLNFT